MLYQDRYVVEFEKESHASEHPNTGALQLYCIRQLAGVKFDDIAVGWVSNRDYKVDLDQEKRQVPYPRDTIRAWFCAALHLKNPTEFLAPMRKVFTDEEVRQGFLWAALPRYGGEAGVNTTLHAANALCDGKPVLECFLDAQKGDIEPLFRFDPVKDNDAFVTNLCRLTVGNGYGLAADALNRFPAMTRARGVRAFQKLMGVEDLFVEATEEPFRQVGLNTRATVDEDLAVMLVGRVVSGTMTQKQALDYWHSPAETRTPLEPTRFSAEVFGPEFATLWSQGISEQWYELAALTDHPKEFLQHMLWWLGDDEALKGLNDAVRAAFPWESWGTDLMERLANRIAQGSMDLRTAIRHLDDDDPLEIDKTLGTEPLDKRWDVARVVAWCRLSVAYGVGFSMEDLREHAPEHIVVEGIRQFYTETLPRQILDLIRRAGDANPLEFRPESIDILRQSLGATDAVGTGLPVSTIDPVYKQAYEVQQGNMGFLAALNGYPKDNKGDGEYAALIESVEPTELATYVVSIGAATPGFVLTSGGPISDDDLLRGMFRTVEGGEDESELRGYLAEAVASGRMTLKEAMTLHTKGAITLQSLEGAVMTQQGFVDAWCRIGLASGEGIDEKDLDAVLSAHIPPEDRTATTNACVSDFYRRFMEPDLYDAFQEKREEWHEEGLAMNLSAALQHGKLSLPSAVLGWTLRGISRDNEVSVFLLDANFWESYFTIAASLPTITEIDRFMGRLEEWALPMDFLGGLRLYHNSLPDGWVENGKETISPFEWIVLKRAYQFIHRWPDQYLAAINTEEWNRTAPVGKKGSLYTNGDALNALWGEFMEAGGHTSINLMLALTGKAAPTLAEKALATFREDAKEVALRTGVRRVRAALADKIAGWWARRTYPQQAGESAGTYEARIRSVEDAQRAFLSTDMGEAALALLVGIIWTQVGPNMEPGKVQEFGDLVAREIRISAGTDLLDGVLTEILDAVKATQSLPTMGTGIRVFSQEVTPETEDYEARQPALEQKKA